MILPCPACMARFMVPDERITRKGVKIRCPKCRFVFIMKAGTDKKKKAPQPAAEQERGNQQGATSGAIGSASGAIGSSDQGAESAAGVTGSASGAIGSASSARACCGASKARVSPDIVSTRGWNRSSPSKASAPISSASASQRMLEERK